MTVEGSDCPTGKWQYSTRKVADEVASAQRRRGKPMVSYPCPLCGCYHLGNRRDTNTKNRSRHNSKGRNR